MLYESIEQMRRELQQLLTWLDKGEDFASQKGFDVNVLSESRLAPDQFPLTRQIQSACDTFKFAMARLTGKTLPAHADEEKTLAELKARVNKVTALFDALTKQDFDGAATREIHSPRWEGKVLDGQTWFVMYSTPNFYFHLAHAYAILRHNGVPLGKKDYLAALPLRSP